MKSYCDSVGATLNVITPIGPSRPGPSSDFRSPAGWIKASLISWSTFQLAVCICQAQPANDNFVDRLSLSGTAVSVEGDNGEATTEDGEPFHGSNTVWWGWVAPVSGDYTISAVGRPGDFLPIVSVYTGSEIAALQVIGQGTAAGSTPPYTAQVVLNAVSGTAYSIAVGTQFGYGGGLGLSISPTLPPTATITFPASDDVFYVGESVPLKAEAFDPDGTITNVVFYVDSEPVASFTEGPYETEVTFDFGPAIRRFQVAATDDWGITTFSSEVRFLTTYPPPPNDDFAERIPVSGPVVNVTGTTAFATGEPDEFGPGQSSVWWSWTAPVSGAYTITAVGLPGYFYPAVAVFTGSDLASLVMVANDGFQGRDDTYAARVVINAIAGTDYSLRIATIAGSGGGLSLQIQPTLPPSAQLVLPTEDAVVYVGDPVILKAEAFDPDGSITNVAFYVDFHPVASLVSEPFELSHTFLDGPRYVRLQVRATDDWGVTTLSSEVRILVTYPPPDNDEFDDRTVLAGSVVSVLGNNQFATHDAGDPGAGDKSVWWSWTAPATGSFVITAVGFPGAFYPQLSVYSGSNLGSLVPVASDSFGGNDSTYAARIVLNATDGVTYALEVTTLVGSGGELNLSISPPALPGTPAGFVGMVRETDGAYSLQFETGASLSYRLESSADLLFWGREGASYLPHGRYTVRVYPAENGSNQFFRLKSE